MQSERVKMFKMGYRLFFAIQFFLINTATSASADTVKIRYADNSYIVYDLATGTLNVTKAGQQVFFNISSSATVDGKIISSKNYSVRKYSQIKVITAFGEGEKHVIILTGNDLPMMKQIFYTYPGTNYFLTETKIVGKKLSTNNIIPFEGDFKKLTGDVRSVFIPFDNDTFISYDSKPFTAPSSNASAEAGLVFDNDNRNGLVAGSVEHMVWKTGVSTTAAANGNTIKVIAGYTDETITRDTMAHGYIKGDVLKSPLIFVGYFDDWRVGMEAYGKANRIAEPPFVFNWTKPTPVGWNSWGVIQEKLNLDNAVKVAEFFADDLKGFRTGNTAYIDLDSYWDNMLTHGPERTKKLKEFVAYCKSKGLEPGVYWAPFTDWGYKSGADRKIEGSNYTWGEAWTKTVKGYHNIDGARAIDPTYPGTQQRIDHTIGMLKDCGFTMIKIDFLGHAAIESTKFYDTTVTTGMQAYRKGMEYLISKLDGKMLIYAAISPSLATGRYVHTRRIACDAFKSISDTRYTLNSVTYGWWQTYLYNYIDADHIVFGNEPEGANRARLLSGIITGTFIAGDDYSKHGQWSARAQKYFQDPELLKVVANGKAFRPVDGDTDKGASEIFTQKIGDSFYVAVFNYSDKAKQYKISAARLGLSAQKNHKADELLSKQQSNWTGSDITVDLPPADAVLYRIDVK